MHFEPCFEVRYESLGWMLTFQVTSLSRLVDASLRSLDCRVQCHAMEVALGPWGHSSWLGQVIRLRVIMRCIKATRDVCSCMW